VDPSGKLATTFPVDYNDVPSAKNFPGKELPLPAGQDTSRRRGRPSEVVYEEGIYVGYRYYSSFAVKPAYEFGYGLSYTKFSYSNLTLSPSRFNGKLTVGVTVTNSGSVAGKEAVELYVSAPGKKLDKPAEELRAFGKTKLLQPGESQILNFTLTASDLASYDTQSSSWIAEAGTYTVKIGASSTDIRGTADFQLTKDIIAEKDSKQISPEVQINELKK
jgi:beta-glucosidase